MTLNYNSFNAKFYRYFYGADSMPDSICPYFWKLLMAWIFVIPVTLFSLPIVVAEAIRKESLGLFRLGVSIIIYMFTYFLVTMVCTVMLFVNDYDKESFVAQSGSTGILIWFVFIVVVIIEGFKYLKNRHENDTVIVGFIKSKYNKYCAKITWK
jgi:hypothetical protein